MHCTNRTILASLILCHLHKITSVLHWNLRQNHFKSIPRCCQHLPGTNNNFSTEIEASVTKTIQDRNWAKSHDQESVSSLETHPKTVTWTVDVKFCVVVDHQVCNVKAYSSGISSKCYFNIILLMWALLHNKLKQIMSCEILKWTGLLVCVGCKIRLTIKHYPLHAI